MKKRLRKENKHSVAFFLYSPTLVRDQVALLESIYENPAYLEDHSNPLEQFVFLEDTIAVRIRKK